MSEWYYAKGGQQSGPVSFEQLKQLAGNGGLDPEKDLVWTSTMKDWAPAGQTAGLFDAAAAVSSLPAADSPASSDAPLPEITPGGDPIRVGECVKRGFELTKRHFTTILLVGLVYLGVSIGAGIVLAVIDSTLGIAPAAPSGVGGSFSSPSQHGSPLNVILTQVISIFLGLGLTRIGLNLVSGKPVEVSMLFGEGRKLLRAICASILFGIMMFVGLILFIIPGIYVALRFGQYMNAIVDRDMGIMESLAYSSSITKNNRFNLCQLALLSFFIVLAGFIALVVGVIFAGPVAWLSWLVAYRWMQYGGRAAMDPPGGV
jgi:hypothetical protein